MDRLAPNALNTPVAKPSGDHVVHLVGRLTDAVFSFLGPVTSVNAERGIRQTVILLDVPMYRHLLPRFHPSIRLVLTSVTAGPLRRLMDSHAALLTAVQAQPTVAVHLHGVIPALLGVYAARVKRLPQGMIISPHGSLSLMAFAPFRAVMTWLLRPSAGRASRWIITATAADAKLLERMTHEPVQLVERHIDPEFFLAPRREARRPLLLTGSRADDATGPALFAQLAVLLSEESLNISCNWHGTADPDSLARLSAANVAVYDASGPSERAARMASAWIYVALANDDGFPVFLAEAMAAGLPCVVWDTPAHRDLVTDGDTALFCNSHQKLLACVAELIDSKDERERLGAAARAEAGRRFDDQRFRDSVHSAYDALLPND